MTCETIHYKNHTESYPPKNYFLTSCLAVYKYNIELTLIILLTDFNTLVLTLGNLAMTLKP